MKAFDIVVNDLLSCGSFYYLKDTKIRRNISDYVSKDIKDHDWSYEIRDKKNFFRICTSIRGDFGVIGPSRQIHDMTLKLSMRTYLNREEFSNIYVDFNLQRNENSVELYSFKIRYLKADNKRFTVMSIDPSNEFIHRAIQIRNLLNEWCTNFHIIEKGKK